MLDRTESSTANSPTRTPVTGGRPAASAEDPLCAMMALGPPPSPWTFADWYLKEIAGVPFLLRNILAVQRGGAQRLIIYHNEEDGAGVDGLARVFDDPRVSLKIDLISDPKIFLDTLKSGKNRFLLSGSALYQKADIARALDSGFSSLSPKEAVFPVPAAELENLINSSQLRISELEQVIMNRVIFRETEAGGFLAAGEGARISSESDFRVQEERLLQACGLSNDSFMDRLVTRRISRQLTRFFVRTTMTPNQITGLSLALGLAAAFLFFQGNYFAAVAGAGVLLLSAWTDCTDGEVARLKFQESKFGSSLDIISDNIVHLAVFISIGMGLYFATGNRVYIALGLLAALGSAVSFALMFAKVTRGKLQASEGRAGESGPGEPDLAAQMANRDFIYLIFLLAVAGQLGVFIFITAIGANVFAVFLAYTKLKPYLAKNEKYSSKNSGKG